MENENNERKEKFTPGPWYLTGSEVGGAMVVSNDKIICRWPLPSDNDSAESVSNGRMMRAAPDMYEALNGLINCHTGAAWQTVEVQRRWWLKATEALAKARGEHD
jgi:hypothetical protein